MMNFKEIFDKEFLFESSKIKEKKMTKIFYKFDINLVKLSEEAEQQPQDQANTVDLNTAQPVQDQTAAQPIQDPNMATPLPADPNATQPIQDPNMAQPAVPDNTTLPMPSVVTEDDNEKVEIEDENNIVRKLEGEVVLSKEEVDEILTTEDIITKLSEAKIEGTPILDEFTADIIQVIANPATQMELKDKVDKKSKIFAEIIYGKKKEDSVGLRIIKRKDSDLLTTSMLIDNKVINAQYKKDTLDKRITDYRNNEFDTENNIE